MERKKTTLLILGVCALVLSVIGVTYAFWQLRLAQKDQNTIGSSCFDVELIDEKDAIQLEKAYPILDEEASSLKPYKFTIKNKCDANASYQINLEALSQYGSTTIAEGIRLRADYIRAQLNEVNKEGEEETEIEKDIVNLKDDIKVDPTLDNEEAKSYDAYKLATGYLKPNESKSFALRIWLDGDLTVEDNSDAMNKTFASKITVITSYLSEEKIPPVAELELAVCDNIITATGNGTTSGGKIIENYEFKLDTDEVWSSNGAVATKEYTVEPGSHTVSVRVTDNKGITSETSKTIDTTSKTVTIAGKEIPIATCKNGLYEVPHDDLVVEEGGILAEELNDWKKTEYRFVGVDSVDHDIYSYHDAYYGDYPGTFDSLEECINAYQGYVYSGRGNCDVFLQKNSDTGNFVHNYVRFNEELWRMIGLVNVKVIKEDGSEGIEQRIKLIRDESIGGFRWDYGVGMFENDWTQATLMEMLNGDYYNSNSGTGNCYQESSTAADCDFSTTGIKETTRNSGMIVEDIIWNIGGGGRKNANFFVTVNMVYNQERGTTVPRGRLPEWRASNTKDSTGADNSDLFHSIALPYASDYAYATNGGTLGREECFKKELNNWSSGEYQTQCAQTDWLKPENSMWLLTPHSSMSINAFRVSSTFGSVDSDEHVNSSEGVWPTLYLSKSVKIVDNDNDGSYEKPYELTMQG